MVKLNLFNFQEKASLKLIDLVASEDSKQTILMKAPTGSGKTIILIDFVDKFLNNVNGNTAFIWLCPGKGDLEKQSMEKMNWVSPDRKTQNLDEALLSGFEPKTTTFINWERVTKKDNLAIRDGEKKNLFDRIADAHRKGIKFVVIIDEEHQNNTSKANDIINAFSAKNIIRVSATVNKNSRFEYFEIDETEVIESGLITKAISVNEDVTSEVNIDDDYEVLLDLADKKRIDITKRYDELGEKIRPLILIQFPNAMPHTIELVEKKLESMGYTYNNGMVSIWMADRKENVDEDFSNNNGFPVFLLMKQAINTGWDCPRAKILVKLRENTSEQFEIQTVGRIRRMPKAKHYEDDLLDFCYVYTFDEKYKEGLLSSIDKAYETRRLFLKDKCKDFSLVKEVRNLDIEEADERATFSKVHKYLKEKYKLKDDKSGYKDNKLKLEASGYVFGNDLRRNIIQGKFVTTGQLAEDVAEYTVLTRNKVNTTKHGYYLLHAVDTIKKELGLQNKTVKTILERLFKKRIRTTEGHNKFLSLENDEFYAFVINNQKLLRDDFKEASVSISRQIGVTEAKTELFKIPEQDFFKYDTNVKNEIVYENNAYNHYTSGFATSLIRSTSEMLFEKYCEKKDDIDWIYKNGDTGQKYFSIVYTDYFKTQKLFYADYIIKKKDGSIWVIETKGGEFKGESKNIDIHIANKFYAFKQYAKKYKVNWGFVRDKDGELYINNTEYIDDMSDDNWKPIEDIF